MANDLTLSEDCIYTPSPAQVDLLEAILQPEDAPYPWNTAAPESEDYFADREQNFLLQDWSEQEMSIGSQTFFTQLEQIWCTTILTADNLGNQGQASY